MRIIILNQYFYPDHSATSQLMTDLAASLVQKGVAVTALAGRGRYNGGDRLAPREDYQGVKIERAWASSFGKRNLIGRLTDYLSFYLGATWKLLRLPKHDLIMALTTPPLISLVALLIGRLRGMRVIALVQDVYPDVAVALGALQADSLTTRLLDALNRLALRHVNRVIVLGECMRRLIMKKVPPSQHSRIDVIHNWADGSEFAPITDEANPFILAHKLQDKFVLLFSGNLGHVNEFATVLEAARRLRERADIRFLFIGEGAKRDDIERFIAAHELTNILVLPYQPRHLLRHSLAAGDALLVTLAEGLAGLSVPSKTYAIMAAGRPLLFVGDLQSDAARLVKEYDCGAAVAAGESEKLAHLIREWAAHQAQLAALGARARTVFDTHFSRELAVHHYLESFAKCLNVAAVPPDQTPSEADAIKALGSER
ncbi:MAG: glycosyltransferase family 4 protein [Acidobacteria bacterium]|nr:glycosyltransferase family 4 protein [Acidobacteriota bacterium]